MNTSNHNHLLIDIDERFAQMILDPLYVRNLNMTILNIKSFFDYTFSIDEQLLDRICSTILPQISCHTNKLTTKQDSMEHILVTANYPQFYSLSLVNFQA